MPKLGMLSAVIVAASLVLSSTVVAKAATVTYWLSLGDNNGDQGLTQGFWTLYAQLSTGDNYGLASYSVALTGATTIVNDGPRATYSDSTGINTSIVTTGFSTGRSTSTSPITGAMDFAGQLGTLYVIPAFGQLGGSLPTASFINPAYDTRAPLTQSTYHGLLKIAHGTYAGFPGPSVAFDTSPTGLSTTYATVLTQNASGYVTPSTTTATIMRVTPLFDPDTLQRIPPLPPLDPVPEPASLAILAPTFFTLLARRRRPIPAKNTI